MKMMKRIGVVLVWFLVASCVSSRDVVCRSRSRAQNGTLVDCSHTQVTSLSDVDISGVDVSDVILLDLSNNQLSEWRSGSLSDLSSLRHLNLGHNDLQELDQHAFQGLEELETLDLSYNNLTALTSRTFANLPHLQRLLLDHNQVTSLGTDVFENLTHLRHLDLGHNHLQVLYNTFSSLAHLHWLGLGSNRLQRLEAGAMTGLDRLINLDLSDNKLQLTSSVYPARVFASLGQLQLLRLENNDHDQNGEYPDNVFSDLVSLTLLSIDTFSDVHFGRDFAALRNIHTLDLSKNCRISHIFNTSFEGFKNSTLSFINFQYCSLQIIEACAFCELPALDRLWFMHSYYQTPNHILESLYGLQHQNMTEIKLQGIGDRLPFNHVIDRHSARYLQQICVKNFTMSSCSIQRIAGNALAVQNTPFFRCVEHIDVSMNAIIGDSSTLIKMMTSDGPLRSLALQDQIRFTITGAQCLVSGDFRCKDHFRDGGYDENTYTMGFRTPMNISYLNISSIFPHLDPLPVNLTFPSAKHLKILDLSYLGFANCRMTFYGLENLETLSLNGNYCHNMTEKMFDFLDSLTKLSLSNFGFNPLFLKSRGWRLFQNVDQLQFLDLSRNDLPFTDPDMLRVQRRLKELDFSDNRLQKVPVNLDNHGDLTTLDLSHNSLSTLTSSERSALDSLAGRHAFSLKLLGNPLECACFNLDVVQWLWHTPVSLDGEGRQAANYTCTTETGEITSTERVMAQWMSHWRRCVGVQMFGIALSAFLLQLLAIVVTFIVVRSWTQLCYAWKAIRRYRLPRRHHFHRDAYVVYSEAQDDVILACVTLRVAVEERYNVRLLLRDREELPGSVRAENVVQHIDDSWKVVLLVTRDFSQDEWACGFTVQQAQRSITDTMPDRVIIVFLEEPRVLPAMPSLQLLLRMVPERNILHVHRDTPPQHQVWKTLADLITTEH
ncbi:insulin-like growth factor-binding protein complex acid labile subunit isoform X1 [Littorina saxatilis]|uniref:insulin-like growth factor-binding protein complex acid labile subunit isoform X1 n=1 Tax=Littorina saxatilis TaxID=31220 RepID=UPI0038B4A5CF